MLFWGILIVLLAGGLELSARVGLRIFRGYDGEHLYQYEFDAYKNIHPTPNFVDTRGVRHNSAGFRRSTEVAVEKPPGTYRIFLMGASTAYGLGGLWPHIQREYAVLKNSETIDAYLERMLEDSLFGTRVEVINAAITSTWTHHHLIYLNQRILSYDPDMVLFLDGFNDFFFFDRRHDQFQDYAYGLPARIIMGEPSLYSLAYANLWWLFRKSAAAHVASRAARDVYLMMRGTSEQAALNVDSALAGLRQVFPRNALKMHERIGLILKAEGVHAVFMLQPLLILERGRKPMSPLERQLFEFNVTSYRPNYETFARRAVEFFREAEGQMAGRVGGTFLDLTTVFAGVEEQMYTDYAHLTPSANRRVAERIAEHVLPLIRSDLGGPWQRRPAGRNLQRR
ncbi:MAG TPA: hypothetical protein VNL96_03920 [Gemmatimonadaceae bacterium]|nr:hypothetical protein [Gemmatimonadaceae bacterium]